MPLLTLDPLSFDPHTLDAPAQALRAAELVAFPTETVYGLGADATNPEAVQKIFAAKGRPANNPLIVHVHDIPGAQRVTSRWCARAQELARAFWPGPLTLVLPRAHIIPDIVTAGMDSVGVRIPAHPIALALLARADIPVCAPSANRYTHISPTRAQHVQRSLGERVSWLIDAGPTQVGIESTVLSLLEPVACILRPGMISLSQLEQVLGPGGVIALDPQSVSCEHAPALAPGLARRHYSPAGRVVLVDDLSQLAQHPPERCGVLRLGVARAHESAAHTRWLPAEPAAYALGLYEALHAFDALGCETIFIERPPQTQAWRAICDRLFRAASP